MITDNLEPNSTKKRDEEPTDQMLIDWNSIAFPERKPQNVIESVKKKSWMNALAVLI
jgi:hypothetical protein